MIRCQPALGTYVEIYAQSAKMIESEMTCVINDAFAAIQTVQSCMSVFDDTSDLSRINDGACVNSPLRIHPWLWQVLALSIEIHRSCPSFDITLGHALVSQGLRPKRDTGTNQQWGTMADLCLLPDSCVQTARCMYLDLGGIAKGYAVDRAVQALQESGVTSGYVNAGGDLRVFGDYKHDVHLRSPLPPHHTVKVGEMQDASMATSGDYWVIDEAAGMTGHLVDPLEHQPISTARSYTVIAAECVVADALTKIFALTKNAKHPTIQTFGGVGLELFS